MVNGKYIYTVKYYYIIVLIELYYKNSCENIMMCPIREIGSGFEYCPYDYLAVYDGRDESAPIIGKFCGVGKFPYSIIGILDHKC